VGQDLFPIDAAANFPARVILERRIAAHSGLVGDRVAAFEQRVYRRLGAHASLMLPLLREGDCIGVLVLVRMLPGAFSDVEIALAQSFVDQALIAIENTRLFNETKEALEQQTATAEVLQVISSSVADTAPVFDKILDSCQHLFATEQLGIFVVEGDMLHAGAWRGSALGAVARSFPKPLADTMTARVFAERKAIQIPDTAAMRDAPARFATSSPSSATSRSYGRRCCGKVAASARSPCCASRRRTFPRRSSPCSQRSPTRQ
jgi:putative methionine-R-sulfoxide reductase with GAF domain